VIGFVATQKGDSPRTGNSTWYCSLSTPCVSLP
jgi:hypothetical protein